MKKTETITVNKGNQYNPEGYRISSDTGLHAWGRIVEGKLYMEGRWSLGIAWKEAGYTDAMIEAEIEATLADGQERVITLEREVPDAPALTPDKALCPKCHTYCNGDCEA